MIEGHPMIPSLYLLPTRSSFDPAIVKVRHYVRALNEVRDHFTAVQLQSDERLSDDVFMLQLRLEAEMWMGDWPEC